MQNENIINPGPLLLFGSGETQPTSGKAYEHLAKATNSNPIISILETPAGFQLNSEKVAQEVSDFLLKRLQNYKPKIHILPARRKDSLFSPDDAGILAPMLTSNWIFMGPGSPTYAVKQLQGSLAYDYIRALHQHGCAICLASAAVLSINKHTLPVYEIYKVGDDPFWADGLNFLGSFGLNITFIPHWNNQDGGKNLDTSRCFMGKERFEAMVAQLSADTLLVGIDEQTALLLDFQQQDTCHVFGKGAIHIIRDGKRTDISNGESFQLEQLGNFSLPDSPNPVFKAIWQTAESAQKILNQAPENVLALMRQRENARTEKKWEDSDNLRAMIREEGWEVTDTPQGPQLSRVS